MQKYRVRLADREYTIVLSEKNEAEENVYDDRTLRINLLGKYDAIADSIGKKIIDKETAKLLISLFLRKKRGYPLAEYSVLLFGEETEVNICDTVDGHILYSAPAGFELSYKRATLPDLVELALCTAYISGKRIRIYEAENIESVGTELLKRLKIVEGLPSAAYAIAVERAEYVLSSRRPTFPPRHIFYLFAIIPLGRASLYTTLSVNVKSHSGRIINYSSLMCCIN